MCSESPFLLVQVDVIWFRSGKQPSYLLTKGLCFQGSIFLLGNHMVSSVVFLGIIMPINDIFLYVNTKAVLKQYQVDFSNMSLHFSMSFFRFQARAAQFHSLSFSHREWVCSVLKICLKLVELSFKAFAVLP